MSAPQAFVLDPLELDALTELVNIGVSRAAVSLAAMVGEQVLLTVPSVSIVTRHTAAGLIGPRDTDLLIGAGPGTAGQSHRCGERRCRDPDTCFHDVHLWLMFDEFMLTARMFQTVGTCRTCLPESVRRRRGIMR